MASKLTVISYIVLCLIAGAVLMVAPWVLHWFGLGDWGDNYFLVFVAQKTGFRSLQHAVSSGWVRGAVTGLGLLNLAMAFWEMFHFRDSVRQLERMDAPRATPAADAARPPHPDHLPRH
jgi:hypothetical protein